MPRRKRPNKEVADIVTSEGMGYAVASYLSHESIANPELAALWKEAEDAMRALEKFLEPWTEEYCEAKAVVDD